MILQIYPFYINIGHIVFYKGLEFIETIRIHTSDSEIVAIEWKDSIGQFQIFRVYNAENMVRLIKQNSNLLQIMNCSHNDETCEKKLKDIEIYEIIKKILECENRLTFDLNTDIIKDIINYYQQAIEFYSAAEDSRFKIFLQKLSKILSNSKTLELLSKN